MALSLNEERDTAKPTDPLRLQLDIYPTINPLVQSFRFESNHNCDI